MLFSYRTSTKLVYTRAGTYNWPECAPMLYFALKQCLLMTFIFLNTYLLISDIDVKLDFIKSREGHDIHFRSANINSESIECLV